MGFFVAMLFYFATSFPVTDAQEFDKALDILPHYEIVKVGNVEEMTLECTAYWDMDPVDASGTGITCTGHRCIPYRTLAVDPKIIPFDSEVYFYSTGETYIADDSGSAIKGYKADKAMDSREAAFKYGRRMERVRVTKPATTYSIVEVKRENGKQGIIY